MAIKIKLADVLKNAKHEQENGQVKTTYPFVESLTKLANDPAQGFKTNYWSGRVLGEVQGWIEAFNKRKDLVIETHGEKQSVIIERALEDLYSRAQKVTDKSQMEIISRNIASLNKRLSELKQNALLDVVQIDSNNRESLKSFNEEIDKAINEEFTFEHLENKFKIVESYKLKGEEIPTTLNGEDCLYLKDIIEPPK